jgi:hypothetical protein
MNTMVRRPVLPFRWLEHDGFDLRTVTDHPAAPLFFAEDVCAAIHLFVPGETDHRRGWVVYRWPGDTITIPDLVDEQGAPRDLYTVDETYRVAGNHPDYQTADFLDFVDTVTRMVEEASREDEKFGVDAEPGRRENESYSVSGAARILTRDPALSYGQRSLFETLRKELGWIDRQEGLWVPMPEPERLGFLIRQKVPVGPKQSRILYPQVRITRTGLEQLHIRLGGVATLQLDAARHLTLLEIE